jgi:3-phosphoshikimate 1-carboxyvinyltransferase
MSDRWTIRPHAGALSGQIEVPGDKNISQCGILFAAMAEGTSRITGIVDTDDIRSAIEAVRTLGAEVNLEKVADGSLEGGITGWGEKGPSQPEDVVSCGASGTTARLLMGMLAPWPIDVTLDGDESLRSRTMDRGCVQLRKMGVRFMPEDSTNLPFTEHGTMALKPVNVTSYDPSSQLKSSLLLAGLYAEGTTTITENVPTRNHTELLLSLFGATTTAASGMASVEGPTILKPAELDVPGDPSSAAYLLCAAVLIPGSAIQVENVLLNPLRLGFLRTIETMGADASRRSEASRGKELAGIVMAAYSPNLHGCEVSEERLPTLYDEVPLLSVVAAHARGVTVFRGLASMDRKEHGRLDAITENLAKVGVDAWTEGPDFFIEGDPDLEVPAGTVFDAHDDHRLALALALMGLVGSTEVTVTGFDEKYLDYRTFLEDVAALSE